MFTFTDAQAYALIGGILWPFVRVLALIESAPVFSHRAVPQTFKIGLAFVISLIIAPVTPAPETLVDAFSLNGLMMLLQQIVVGASMGFGLSAIFGAFEMAGDLIGMQMGLGFASFIDPQRGTPSPVIATALMMIAMLAFLGSDSHLVFLMALGESFHIMPISPHPLENLDWMRLAALGTIVFSSGLQIALPVMAAVLSINIALGFMSRSAPQMNLFNLGFAITLLAGLLLLWLVMGVMAGPVEHLVNVPVPYFKGAVLPNAR